MMKFVGIVFCLLLGSGCGNKKIVEKASDQLTSLKLQNEYQLGVIESKKPVIVKFGAPWCSYCVKMIPVLNKLAQEFSSISFYSINIDDDPIKLNELYHVEVLPTFLFFKDGKVLYRNEGSLSEDALKKLIARYFKI